MWLIKPNPANDDRRSVKNLHLVVNCERGLDLINRGLPGCRELALHEVDWDPDDASDRQRFVETFCRRLKIELGQS